MNTQLRLNQFDYSKGLHELGKGLYAYLQPDGGWGFSNAGLIVDGDQSLVVDTLFDLYMTGDMLKQMKDAEPKAMRQINTLVNTHAHGDHCNGNCLCHGAEIIASKAAADQMTEAPPTSMAYLVKEYKRFGEFGKYFYECFHSFQFEGIEPVYPTKTFEGNLTLKVGDKQIHLVQVGPSHSFGDILVEVPEDKTIYTGDILFIEGHPILWLGPVKNWLDTCQRILNTDVEIVVPGHGPITDKKGVKSMHEYFTYITKEARKRYDEGMGVLEAALDISLVDYGNWGDSERIAMNVNTLYKEFSGDQSPLDGAKMYELAAKAKKARC